MIELNMVSIGVTPVVSQPCLFSVSNVMVLTQEETFGGRISQDPKTYLVPQDPSKKTCCKGQFELLDKARVISRQKQVIDIDEKISNDFTWCASK